MATNPLGTKSCGRCGNDAALSCCAQRHCTMCFYTSKHVSHTSSHSGLQSKGAAILNMVTLRKDLEGSVQPLFEKVWSELAADIAQESERLARKAESDPLGELVDAPVVVKKRKVGPPAVTSTSSTTVAPPQTEPGRAAGCAPPPTLRTARARRAPAEAPVSAEADLFRRVPTRPRDIWSHSAQLAPPGDTAETPVLLRGPQCPDCESTDTERGLWREDAGGRKNEIWGSNAEDLRAPHLCRNCGFSWTSD